MHFCNDSTGLVWDAVAVLNFMVILHADRSYFFFLISLTESISILPVNYLNSFSTLDNET